MRTGLPLVELMKRTLIICYSRRGWNYANGSVVYLERGNTEIAAEYIARETGAEIFGIETVKPYSDDYTARAELRAGARPELRNYLSDISGYDNIVVAGPCWWGTYPCAVFSQLERLDFAGRKVFPLMTHEGSGMGRAAKDLAAVCRGAVIAPGLAVTGSAVANSRDMIAAWARKNLA